MRWVSLIYGLYFVFYFLVASQAAFYRICFSQVFRKIPPLHFLNIRKLADPILAIRLALIYYSCLFLGLVMTILSVNQGFSQHSIAVTVSYLLLIIDVFLAKRYNIPLNKQASNPINATEAFATELQIKWMNWLDIRSYIILTGFIFLIINSVVPAN